MNSFKRYGSFFLGILIVATGSAIMVKASSGVSPYNAFAQSLAFLANIKIGTMLLIMNTTLVVIQVIVLKKDFKPIGFLQVFNSMIFSYFFNFILYNVFSFIQIDSYIINISMFIGALVVLSFGVSLVMNADLVGFPPEEVCKAIALKTDGSFPKYRQYLDFLSIAATLVLVLIFKAPLPIREGTVISALAFGPLLGFFIERGKSFAIA